MDKTRKGNADYDEEGQVVGQSDQYPTDRWGEGSPDPDQQAQINKRQRKENPLAKLLGTEDLD